MDQKWDQKDKKRGESKKPKTPSSFQIAVLGVVGGEYSSTQVFKLHKRRIVIGSLESSDIVLHDRMVSPVHAVLEITPEGCTLFDMASDTGILLNGKKIVRATVSTNDEFKIAGYTLGFTLETYQEPKEKRVRFERVHDVRGRKLFVDPGEDLRPLMLLEESEVEDIFEYYPESVQALEVVMSWQGTILDVEHFVGKKEVVLSQNEGGDFGVPALLSVRDFILVDHDGAAASLHVDPKMKGVVQRNGELISVHDLWREKSGSSKSMSVKLDQHDFAKLSVGDIDFYISFVPAPPKLKRKRLFARDAVFFKIMSTSLVLTTAMILTLLGMPTPEKLEAEELPERIATIIYQPEKYVRPLVQDSVPVEKSKLEQPKIDEKKPKVTKIDFNDRSLKKKTQGDPSPVDATGGKQKSLAQGKSKEGEGRKAKGQSGTRGSTKSNVVLDQPQNRAGGGGGSQAEDLGNVDLLKEVGSQIEDILGGVSGGGKKQKAIQGFGGFETRGGGGLALSGEGKGGGGDSKFLGGLGEKGRGGGRVGTGLGAAGTGKGIVGGRARVLLRTGGPEETVIMGSIDGSAIEAALLRHRDEFRLCYEREINADSPNLSGRVGTTFVIGSNGRVTQAAVTETSLKNVNVERCIVKVIRRIDFPKPEGGGIVQVKYPFKFHSVNR